jgi:hypothetical protein
MNRSISNLCIYWIKVCSKIRIIYTSLFLLIETPDFSGVRGAHLFIFLCYVVYYAFFVFRPLSGFFSKWIRSWWNQIVSTLTTKDPVIEVDWLFPLCNIITSCSTISVGSVVLIFLFFCAMLYIMLSLSSSYILCAWCCQCLFDCPFVIAPSVFSNVYSWVFYSWGF